MKLLASRHIETLSESMIYKVFYFDETFGDQVIWARPKSMFFETVEQNGQIVSELTLCIESIVK